MDLINGKVVLRLEAAGVVGTVHASEWLVVGGVCHETSNGSVTTGVRKDFFEDRSDLGKVVGPT